MTEFRIVSPEFAVAAQLAPADVARAADAGFKLIVNNRPDGETGGQASGAEIKAAAEAAGIGYRAMAFTGPPPPAVVAEMAQLIEQNPGSILAYCRTGTRSITAWAMAEALQGLRRPDELIAMAAKAGYDLSGARGALERLSPA